MDVRLVSEKTPGAYSVLKENERFDIIISSPPWTNISLRYKENNPDKQLVDIGLELIKSIMADLSDHLNPGGAALLSINNTHTIDHMKKFAAEHNLKVEILDEKTNASYIRAAADTDPYSGGFLAPAAIVRVTPLPPKAFNGVM